MVQVKRPKKPLMFYYTIVLIILILFNIIAMPYIKEKQIKDVDYGTFISMTEKKEIKKETDKKKGWGENRRKKKKI